jgi:hypothetical protein
VASLCRSFVGIFAEGVEKFDEAASHIPAGLGTGSGDTAGFGESFLAFAGLAVVCKDGLDFVERGEGDFDFVRRRGVLVGCRG